MSNANTLTPSKTNWAEFDALTNDQIDTSDTPEMTPEMFAKARHVVPNREPVTVQLEIDPVLLAWFQLQGEDYQQTMRDALLEYAQAHKHAAP